MNHYLTATSPEANMFVLKYDLMKVSATLHAEGCRHLKLGTATTEMVNLPTVAEALQHRDMLDLKRRGYTIVVSPCAKGK